MKHTYALLDVSPATYIEIKERLVLAGYEDAINDIGEIDMHGLALKEPPKHNGGCSNQNVISPLGPYDDVEECGCNNG